VKPPLQSEGPVIHEDIFSVFRESSCGSVDNSRNSGPFAKTKGGNMKHVATFSAIFLWLLALSVPAIAADLLIPVVGGGLNVPAIGSQAGDIQIS
jgi:hypothetical protein